MCEGEILWWSIVWLFIGYCGIAAVTRLVRFLHSKMVN